MSDNNSPGDAYVELLRLVLQQDEVNREDAPG